MAWRIKAIKTPLMFLILVVQANSVNFIHMESYMVNVHLDKLDEEFWELLPAHRKIVNDLLIEGVIEMYAISEDRSSGWIVFHAENQELVVNIVENFPIRDYFTYEITGLFILNNAVSLWPKVHLN